MPKINYPVLKALAMPFTWGAGPFGFIVGQVEGDAKAPRHVGLITQDRSQFFITEETFNGLQENSLAEYEKPRDKIIDILYWDGWDDLQRVNAAMDFLAEIRRKAGENSKYDIPGLLVYVREKMPPALQWLLGWAKPDPNKQWCSENVFSVHQRFGFNADWSKPRPPNPMEMYQVARARSDVHQIRHFYL